MKNTSLLLAALAALATAHTASAHLTYGGRDFGTLVEGTSATTIANQTLSSSFGWADASDADWGDSHRGRFFRFTLTDTTTVVITAQRNTLGTGANGTLLPAISLFAGLGTLSPEAAGHDSSALSISSRPGSAEGNFRSLADWSLGNDPTYNIPGDPLSGVAIAARLANFTYLGNAVDGTSANYGDAVGVNGDGNADGFVTGTFSGLAPGNYSIFIGGANYTAQLAEPGPSTFPTYGVTVSIQAIPEPSTSAAAMGLAALGLIIARRRRR